MKLPMRSWSILLAQLSPSSRRRRRANKKKFRDHHIQSLEGRTLMTVTVTDNGTAWYNDHGSGTPSDYFGATTVGVPVDKTFTIQNTDSTDLATSSLSLPGGFSLVGSFPGDVPAGGTASFTVEMGATSSGS